MIDTIKGAVIGIIILLIIASVLPEDEPIEVEGKEEMRRTMCSVFVRELDMMTLTSEPYFGPTVLFAMEFAQNERGYVTAGVINDGLSRAASQCIRNPRQSVLKVLSSAFPQR